MIINIRHLKNFVFQVWTRAYRAHFARLLGARANKVRFRRCFFGGKATEKTDPINVGRHFPSFTIQERQWFFQDTGENKLGAEKIAGSAGGAFRRRDSAAGLWILYHKTKGDSLWEAASAARRAAARRFCRYNRRKRNGRFAKTTVSKAVRLFGGTGCRRFTDIISYLRDLALPFLARYSHKNESI